ncbi:MAG: hypothetical protein FWH27_05670, partial [Planctomycetaceae bacterium]|nr:hypothetical protein [Planctomycetaceae bacterium]
HRVPENNYSAEQTRADIVNSLRILCHISGEKGMTVSLRVSNHQHVTSLEQALALSRDVNAENLKIAPHLGILAHKRNPELRDSIKERTSFILASAPLRDVGGDIWTFYAPISNALPEDQLALKIPSLFSDIPVIHDAVFQNRDEEYLDAILLKQ